MWKSKSDILTFFSSKAKDLKIPCYLLSKDDMKAHEDKQMAKK